MFVFSFTDKWWSYNKYPYKPVYRHPYRYPLKYPYRSYYPYKYYNYPYHYYNYPYRCLDKLDIIVLLDGSSSIGTTGFQSMKIFFKDLVSHFNIGSDKVQVSTNFIVVIVCKTVKCDHTPKDG